MKKIAVPIWNGRVSSVFDFAETLQLITLKQDRELSRQELDLTGKGDLERSNCLIAAGPDVLLCGAISRGLDDRLTGAGINVVSLVCGSVDQVIEAYLKNDLDRPEFQLPGCRTGLGRCSRRRRGRCDRHSS
jgi:predicted Fe-Mo cluster-binding NifX family protein